MVAADLGRAAMIDFKSLPLIVRLTTIANIFIAWVLFAEFVIDRHGWDRFVFLSGGQLSKGPHHSADYRDQRNRQRHLLSATL